MRNLKDYQEARDIWNHDWQEFLYAKGHLFARNESGEKHGVGKSLLENGDFNHELFLGYERAYEYLHKKYHLRELQTIRIFYRIFVNLIGRYKWKIIRWEDVDK